MHDHAHPTGAALTGPDRRAATRALKLTLAVTASFTLIEVVGGVLADSLALLADAAHMLSDNASLGIALFAAWIAARPAGPNRTFGYRRAEILAALFNGVTLVAISIWIFIEAANRFGDPPEVEGGLMLAVATAGLVVNLVAARILYGHADGSLNVSAALRHVLADLLGSIGVIAAAAIILTTGWEYADPAVSVLIGLLILVSSWGILRDSTQVLLEGSPAGTDVAEVGNAMAAMPGVSQVHDLHVWEITSGFPALAAHVLVGRETDCHATRRDLETMLHERFGLEHTTLQLDHEGGELLQIETAAGLRAAPDQGRAAEKLSE